MSEVVIQVRDLRMQFGDHVVHDQLDLDVMRGETIGVIGPSGCGKSVLLSQIVGLIDPSAGTIKVFGEELDKLSKKERQKIERRWAVMFQDGALFSNLTVRENVMAPMREHTDFSQDLMVELADLKIRLSGLSTEAATKRPSELSGGMRKRAALARALALDPELLFLDEPTAGLDPITAGRFDSLVRDLSQLLGLTVFLVTHDLDTLKATCDRIAVLGDKRVKHIGPLAEIAGKDDPWLQEYFGGPRGRAVV
tara:strand:- start:9217 stop:9972 length:756 start_codon:yes stop_codon:yes gene_type:complete